MPAQLSLLRDDPSEPEGLRCQAEFITPAQESALIARIRAQPLAPFQFGAYEGKRRVAYYGSSYDFIHQRLEHADPIPEWLAPLAAQIERFGALAPGSIKHALLTEYETGAGIGWHRDKKDFDEVFGISLGYACKFRFRPKAASKLDRFKLDAQPRSLYVMTGEARHIWEHSIPPWKRRAIQSPSRPWRGRTCI